MSLPCFKFRSVRFLVFRERECSARHKFCDALHPRYRNEYITEAQTAGYLCNNAWRKNIAADYGVGNARMIPTSR